MQSTDPNIKRKNRPPMQVLVNQWGCLLAFVMLGLGAGMGFLGAIFIGPSLLGFDLTATALMDREIILAATDVELDVREQSAQSQATSFAFDVLSTQAILSNEEDLLAQTATQSAQQIIATNTASAAQNAQRQTQVANDFVSTQAALNANATQVDIDFRNTQAALGVETTNSQSEDNLASTPLARYSFDMRQFDFTSSIWQVFHENHWQVRESGLFALNETAWLLESTPRILSTYGFENVYTIETNIVPATVDEADYWLLFSIGEQSGLAAYFRAETETVTEVGIYRFERSQLDGSLNINNLTVIQRNAANVLLTDQLSLAVSIDGQFVSLLVDEEIVLSANGITIESGAIGLQLPAGSGVVSLAVND